VIKTLTNLRPPYWGAVYSAPRQPQPELYKLKRVEAEGVRQVTIQKNAMFDHVAGMIASEQIVFKSGPFDGIILKHLTDMRRMRDMQFDEMRYKWVKSAKGTDHFFHTLIYLVTASKLIEKSSTQQGLPMGMHISSFRQKKM
jgi:hypothetical protein